MGQTEKLEELSKALRDTADAVDDVVSAIKEEDGSRVEATMGKFLMKMIRLNTLKLEP